MTAGASRAMSNPAPAAAEKSPKKYLRAGALCLGLILLLAFGLRMIQPSLPWLWIDEVDVFWNSGLQFGPWEKFYSTIRYCFENNTNEQMPFQYVWLNTFLRVYKLCGVEPDVAWIRFPFALLGFLSLWALYPAVRRLYDRSAALWTCLLMAVSFYHVNQSRDVTSYGALMCFLALHLYGLGGWLQEGGPRRRDRAAYAVGVVGMIISHFSAWFFLASEGLVLLVRAILARLRAKERPGWKSELLGGRFEPMLWLGACAAPFLIIVYRAFTIFKPPGLKEDVELSRLTLAFLHYQLAHFGWGWGGGRLLGFTVVLLFGLWAMGRRPDWRRWAPGHLALYILPTILLFVAPHAVIYPRYLTVTFVPFIALAGIGAAALTDSVARALRLGERIRWLPALALALLILGWHLGPYRAFFRMRAKQMPIPQLIDRLQSILPEGGLYVWQSVYNLRDVPRAYPVPGRQAACATMHAGNIKASPAAEQWGPFARDLFQRFPLAVFLATDFPEPPEDEPWAWLGTDFAHREVIRNPELETLHEYALSLHGVNYPSNIHIVCYYNLPEDLPVRAGGKPFLVYPDGPGWQYQQMQNAVLLAAPGPRARFRVLNLTGAPVDARLLVDGAAGAPGFLRVTPPGQMPLTKNFQPANQLTLEFGPVRLSPGASDLAVEAWPTDRVGFLMYSARIEPVPSKEGE